MNERNPNEDGYGDPIVPDDGTNADEDVEGNLG